jgi:hypothetical protein
MCRSLGAGIAALAFLAGVQAHAVTQYVTNTVTTGLQPIMTFSDGGTNLFVQKFNPGTNATLVSVKMLQRGLMSASVSGENDDPIAEIIKANLTGHLDFTMPNGDPDGMGTKATIFGYSTYSQLVAANATFDWGTQSMETNSSLTVYEASMADPSVYSGPAIYEGPSFWTLNLTGAGAWSISGANNSKVSVQNFNASETFDVIYGYTGTIPEPTSVALLGLTCLGFYYRRRFNKTHRKW